MIVLPFQSSSQALKASLSAIEDEACLMLTDAGLQADDIVWHRLGRERLEQVARDAGAGLVFADCYGHPLIDYQAGSLRDDFDFGKVVLLRMDAVRSVLNELPGHLQFGAFYALRLALSRHYPILHLKETLYRLLPQEHIDKEARQFAYVDPKLRAYQLEMEAICTEHLQKTGAFLSERVLSIDPNMGDFPVEASVVIPVRNRVRTIGEAVLSALQQQCDFPFNVIVVDNHSNDGTSEVLLSLAREHANLQVLQPETDDLNIGGCWNLAIDSVHCGRYAVQLDSDDLYSSPATLQQIVDVFRRERCAMVVGSYRICNFQKETLPPGLIDHREWTSANGHNNALRINGLGAPRAFFTPVLRDLHLPNTSYGEDYAVGLAITRRYRLGRIFDELYLCRRWEGNSDANISQEKLNANNSYKDSLRSIEILARQAMNRQQA